MSPASVNSLPGEIKLLVISHLRPFRRELHKFPSIADWTATALWNSDSFLLPATVSALTCLSGTSREWYHLCKSSIWERVNLENITLQGLLEFVSYLMGKGSAESGIGRLIKAIHFPSKAVISIPVNLVSFSRRLSALDGYPIYQFPHASRYTCVASYEPQEELAEQQWYKSCYMRLVTLLLSPSVTPNLQHLSIPKDPWVNSSYDILIDYPRLLFRNFNQSLTTLSIDLTPFKTYSSFAKTLPFLTALQELSLSSLVGHPLDDHACEIVISAVQKLKILSTLRLTNPSLSTFCINFTTQFQSTHLRHLEIVIPFTYYLPNIISSTIKFTSQWSRSLRSLLIAVLLRCANTPPSPLPPHNLSASPPTFAELQYLEINVSTFYTPPPTNKLLLVLLQQPLPTVVPSLKTLTLYLPPDVDPTIISLPAVPKVSLRIVSRQKPCEDVEICWRSLVEDSVEFTWIQPVKEVTGFRYRSRRQKPWLKKDGLKGIKGFVFCGK